MPRCPACAKRFKTETHVLQHMNQPLSSCVGWTRELTHVENPARRRIPVRRSHLPGQTLPPVGCPDTSLANAQSEDQMMADEDQLMQDCTDGDPIGSDQVILESGDVVDEYPGAADAYGPGQTFMDRFDADNHAEYRESNLYYPFASRDDWEVGEFLERSSLSMAAIDEFLSLDMIQRLPLSFNSAKELRGRVELLPTGPQWKFKTLQTEHPTKAPVRLFYRDPVECLEVIFGHPHFARHIDFVPRRVYKTAERLVRVYSEWMSGDAAWEMQEKLPPGATLLGTILSSDKTNVSSMTGNRIAHPLLIGLANIRTSVRMKYSNNAFFLCALLPVAKFIHQTKRICGVLNDRLVHRSLDVVLEPLKIAARIGIMMSDAFGNRRFCFTPLAAYIADTQEAILLSCVGGKTSPLTMAMFKQFGDPFRHEPRTAFRTLTQLQSVTAKVDSRSVEAYFREAQTFRLNGVAEPFWRDWPMADPSQFLTPEPLHHWHRQFWDHDAKWCIRALGEREIDFRFSVLPRIVGFRHFREGISKLKQVTGREQRDAERYIVGVIAGAAAKGFVIAIRALMDFRYLCQAPILDDNICSMIRASLNEFHLHKMAILDAGARVGKGNREIDNWYIPKLELMQSVEPSIRRTGVPIQWSADLTEHAHITEVKDPARSANNQQYDPQICRFLDRREKCRRFRLATSTRETEQESQGALEDSSGSDDGNESEDHSDDKAIGRSRPITNYFAVADRLGRGLFPSAPRPYRTFANSSTVFHLGRDPNYKMLVDETAQLFGIPDLRPALADHLRRVESGQDGIQAIGGRRTAPGACGLPFSYLQIWSKVRLQLTPYHNTREPASPRTINSSPPSPDWPSGRFETAILCTESSFRWPYSGLAGHCVVEVRLIMLPVLDRGCQTIRGLDQYLVYAYRYDVVPQSAPGSRRAACPELTTGMYVLKRGTRTNGSRIGDVVSLSTLRAPAPLLPRFVGASADPRLTMHNSLNYSSEAWLNKYHDHETFYALSLDPVLTN